MARISHSLTCVPLPVSGSTRRTSHSSGRTTGRSRRPRAARNGAANSESRSALRAAKLFGVISPKKRTRSVMTPVASPTPAEPNSSVAV